MNPLFQRVRTLSLALLISHRISDGVEGVLTRFMGAI
jgi:hypothetical protein